MEILLIRGFHSKLILMIHQLNLLSMFFAWGFLIEIAIKDIMFISNADKDEIGIVSHRKK